MSTANSASRMGAIVVAVVLAFSLGVAASALLRSHGAQNEVAAGPADEVTRSTCPMPPEYESDRPGNCPICSMKLVARPAERVKAQGGHAPMLDDAQPQAPSIAISPERQQQIGMRFAAVERIPATVEVRAVGKGAFDDSRITHVNSKVSAWIEEVFVDFVGAPLKQ